MGGHPHSNLAVKNKRVKVMPFEETDVTFVVPNLIDSVQMRAIFDEALMQQIETDDGEIDRKPKEDLLVNHLILEAINSHKTKLAKANPSAGGGDKPKSNRGKCPFCKASRLSNGCVCNYHLVYAYKMTDQKEKPLQLVSKSKQRGGPARLLSTPLSWHAETRTRKGRENPEFFRLRDGFQESSSKQELDKLQPRFGILAISPNDMYFLEEDP